MQTTERILEDQVDSFIDLLQEYNKHRLMPRGDDDYAFLRDFFPRSIEDQNSRSEEVTSEKYQKVLHTAKKQFLHKPHWVLCVDGRVLLVLAYGATADIDNSVKIAGGMVREFVRGTDGKLFLRRQSNFAKLLEQALELSKTDAIIEVFDSHVACAARQVEEEGKGKYPDDSGLLADVHHKKQMVSATNSYVKKLFGSGKYALCIQTSFDPHTGFLYMGLETPGALQYANRRGRMYTKDILRQLVVDGIILSTHQMSEEPKIKKVLQRYDFSLTWKNAYVQSAVTYWKNVEKLREDLLPILKKKVLGVYPELSSKDKRAQEEVETRAFLLLLNLYCGFLENIHPEAESDSTSPEENGPHRPYAYAYGVHEEEAVRISEGSFPPYKISSFPVFSLDEINLQTNIEHSCALVRMNRKEGRVIDRSKTFHDAVTFARAPVPATMQEIVRDERLTKEDWEMLQDVDWSDLPFIPWDTMRREEFEEYVAKKVKLPQTLIMGIQRLRQKMRDVWNPAQTISHHLVNQDEVILPMLTDRSRFIRTIIPFVKLGYEQ